LRDTVPKLGLETPFRGRLCETAREMVALALGGLERRARRDKNGEDERKALAPLVAAIEEGLSPADRLLALYHGPWQGEIDKVFEAQAF
jgi:glutamate--cysteine ligase